MNKGFLKFKNKLFIGALIKSAIFGASVGVFVSSILILIAKLSKEAPNPTVYLPIGVSSALLFAAVLFLVLLPSEKRVAKKLDTAFALGEKAQTMIAFKNKKGDVIEMQRRDTERILSETRTGALKSKNVWLHFIMPTIAVIMTIAAMLIPTYNQTPPPASSDPDFQLSVWQEQALKDLIEEVKRSDMENAPRNKVVSELEDLLTELRAAKKVSVMKASVIGVIKSINETVDNHNSCFKIASEMNKGELESTKSLASAIQTLSAITLGEELKNIRESLVEESAKDSISAISLALNTALTKSGVDENDPLYASLSNFASSLSDIATSYDQMSNSLDDTFTGAGESISSALLIQYTNERVGDNATLRLMQIFGIKESEIPKESIPSDTSVRENEGDYDPEDNDDPLHSGGFGSGDMIFGSDDMIYDPELGKYVSYGEVINKYYAKISEQMVDGNLSDELEQLLSDYFASLFDGSKTDKD